MLDEVRLEGELRIPKPQRRLGVRLARQREHLLAPGGDLEPARVLVALGHHPEDGQERLQLGQLGVHVAYVPERHLLGHRLAAIHEAKVQRCRLPLDHLLHPLALELDRDLRALRRGAHLGEREVRLHSRGLELHAHRLGGAGWERDRPARGVGRVRERRRVVAVDLTYGRHGVQERRVAELVRERVRIPSGDVAEVPHRRDLASARYGLTLEHDGRRLLALAGPLASENGVTW